MSGGTDASLAGRYASALFELARDERRIDDVSASLARLGEALRGGSDLQRLIASPLVTREESTRAIGAVAGQLGLDALTTNFLGVIARNRRLSALPAILRSFDRMAARHRGETTAEVVSAHPLGPDQLDVLRAKLRQRLGRDVSLQPHVDPAILGGLVVTVGSQRIDGSIRTKLNTLAQAMKG